MRFGDGCGPKEGRFGVGGMGARLNKAFTLIELLLVIVVLAMVALLMLLYFSHRVARAPKINCANNLRQVGLAFRVWALDHNEKYPMQVSITNHGSLEFVDGGAASSHYRPLSNELYSPKLLICPADPGRKAATTFGDGFDDQHLSYFVGVDATPTNPQMFLTGDRNLTNGASTKGRFLNLTSNEVAGWTGDLHTSAGNIGLADGSVQQFGNSKLRNAIELTGAVTNRLVMP